MNEAPALTLDMENQSVENFDETKADTELENIVSYMLGTKNVNDLGWNEALALVEKYYANQPQWKKLLLDYFSYVLEKKKENIIAQQTALFQEILKQLDTQKSDAQLSSKNEE